MGARLRRTDFPGYLVNFVHGRKAGEYYYFVDFQIRFDLEFEKFDVTYYEKM